MNGWILVISIALTGCASLAGDTAVEYEHVLPVDGAGLYMIVRGEHETAPLLIRLHGGPGGAERPLFRLYNSPLEERFPNGHA